MNFAVGSVAWLSGMAGIGWWWANGAARTPWVSLIIVLAGALVAVLGAFQKPRPLVFVLGGLMILVAGLLWANVLMTQFPELKGPLKVGAPLPKLSAGMGASWPHESLSQSSHLIVFFRGHW